ncbi:MAG: cobalamin B12-binding domain-containing protein [Bacteroidota bacterium]
MKISHLAELGDKEICSKINDLSASDQDNEYTLDNLVISMIELDEKKFEKILSLSILRDGFETTLINTIYPFFEKIGVLWLTGAINPAQEHFISNLIRQKLIVAIDNTVEQVDGTSKTFILYLPEGELHEIGLLFHHYLLKKRGHRVIYLGQSVPFDDLTSVTKIRSSDYIVTSFGSSITGIDVNKYLMNLGNRFPQHTILFSSYEGSRINGNLPKNIRQIKNSTEFQLFLNELE